MNNFSNNYIADSEQIRKINNGLKTADVFINKSYLLDVTDSNVLMLNDDDKNAIKMRLFNVESLVYDKEENVNDKLISVYSSLLNINSSALLIIRGNGEDVSFYLGVRSESSASIAGDILQKSFLGNFPGSELNRLFTSEISELMNSITDDPQTELKKNVSCVTVVPSTRDEDKNKFVQGIEKFIDTMQGESFTAVLIAEPLSPNDLELRKRGLEEMYSSLSPYQKTTLAYGDNYSKAVSEGMSESFTDGINNSINITNGTNKSASRSKTKGVNLGASGIGANSGSSVSYTTGTSWSQAVTSGTSQSSTLGTSSSTSETNGTSRTLTTEHQNKSVADLLQQIDEQLKRIKDCEGFGLWECAAYFIADDIQTSVVAANTYKALMLGDKSSVENSYVNIWTAENINRNQIIDYIRFGMHPLLEIQSGQGFNSQIVTPGNIISGKELPLLFGIPRKSVSGITVSHTAEFGRNVYKPKTRSDQKFIQLGKIHHMHKDENRIVNFDLNSFTSHCFITGSTGSGKSNTTYCLLERFYESKIPFLIIEPAKGEYKEAFGGLNNINIFTTSPLIGQLLKINPFRFDEKNIHILEHLDRLIEIFNACWEMYAAMPAILKEAVEKIYVHRGWDLLNSFYTGKGDPIYPTFEDLMKELPAIINNSGYSSDTKGDYIGALVTRVNSLTNGISGQIFCDIYDIPDSTLFDENTIIDLSRVGSSETKSLIMGILVLKLSEYRMGNADQANSGLRHITVMEEAHNLLKKADKGAAGSNVVGKSVEMICNSIAEMRTYGEGFIIVDQSPTSVDIAAIKNTNTKIIMRLPEKNDCEAVGNAVGLDDNQIKELSKLETGIAVVMQNNWHEAVLTRIDKYNDKYISKVEPASITAIKELRGQTIQELMEQFIVQKKMDIEQLNKKIDSVNISAYKKAEMKCCVEQIVERIQNDGRNVDYFCKSLMNISGTKGLFTQLEPLIVKTVQNGEETYTQESIKIWYDQLKNSFYDYLFLPEVYMKELINWLIVYKELDIERVNYAKIFEMLEQGVK